MIARGVSETLWLVGDYMTLLFSSKRNIDRVEVTIRDIPGKDLFGKPFAIAAAPWEIGTIITVIAIDNVVYVSFITYLLSVLFRFTYCKSSSQIRHLQRSCRSRVTIHRFIWTLFIAAVADVVEIQRYRTTPVTVVEYTRSKRAYSFGRELQVVVE